ncbi:MAG: hypothetical protein Tp1111DCM511881_31 [Prokaryotic dsDNA virus sp.]|nr:MAG: hypothetical protein Tp1111DCM511881_31 [Prokaryotic dsDNA virus sp.]|tara:strand:- start:11463 stop:12911 length:1449 start_codon:yes stop_codon:yes gene_type:complete
MDFLDNKPDLSTPDGARKAIHDVHKAAKELRDENGKLRANMDAMTTDLKAAQKSLQEARASLAAPSKGDSELGRYITAKGIRTVGKENEHGVYLPGLLDDTARNDWQEEFQKACETYTFASAALGRPHKKALSHVHHIMTQAPSAVRRAFDSQAGSGGEFIPAPVLPLLEKDVIIRGQVMSLFDEIAVSSNSQTMPVISSGLRPYLKGSVTSDNPAQFEASSLGTAERTIAPKGMAVRTVLSDDAEEDAIFDMVPLLRSQAIEALVHGVDDCIVNGDSAATHQDALASWNTRGLWGSSGLGTSIDHRRGWLGLRARAYDQSATVDRSTYSYANFLADLADLATPRGIGGTEGNLIYMISPEGYLANVAGLDQVSLVANYGPQASVLNGEIAKLGGARVVLSDMITADLAATGLYTGSGSKTGALIFNASRHKMFIRRGQRVELSRDATRGITSIITTWRGQFKAVSSSATVKDVIYEFNLSS